MSHEQCRACLDDYKNTKSGDLQLMKLGDICHDTVTNLDAFKECTRVEAVASENICRKCSEELSKFYKFLNKVRATDVVLKMGILHKDPLEDSDPYEADTISEEPVPNYQIDASNRHKVSENINYIFKSGDQVFVQGRCECHICGMTYFTSVGLEVHMEIHLPNRNKSRLKRRIRKTKKKKGKNDEKVLADQTQPEPEKNNEISQSEVEVFSKDKKVYPCRECGKEFLCASKLRSHTVMHTGEKNFLCNVCPKIYSTIYALNHHMRSHTGERPYECSVCGDKFFRPTTLKSHIRRHTGERPYSCQQCGKKFIQHSSMATHMKLNHMEKTLACSHCDKKYARQVDLNTHLLSHTGDKPFACQLCPTRFIRQANLNKHMNQFHKGTFTTNMEKPKG